MRTFVTIHQLADGSQGRRRWEADNLAHAIEQVNLADFADETLIGAAEAESIETYAVNPSTGEVIDCATLLLALDDLAEGSEHLGAEVGPHLTCREVDRLAAVLAYAGHVDAAVAWITGHGAEDEGSDVLTDDTHGPVRDAYATGRDADAHAFAVGYLANLTL